MYIHSTINVHSLKLLQKYGSDGYIRAGIPREKPGFLKMGNGEDGEA
jgi:hypothetical protein